MKPNQLIVVFLGPSLSLEQARQRLPDALFLPPARSGDILHVVKLNPSAIVLIDGYFENTPAIWHKEILFALERGITVIGAASMGALRAAELDQYGMIGIGKIYQDYKEGRINQDDEVAVLHHQHQSNYKAVTDAMVNIRATLAHALEQEIIDVQTAEQMIKQAKSIHYKERKLEDICSKNYPSEQYAQNFLKFLDKGGYINQKALDAELALTYIRNRVMVPHPSPMPVPKTLFFRGLLHQSCCEHFPSFSWDLPEPFLISNLSRIFLSHYSLFVSTAMLWFIATEISKETPFEYSSLHAADVPGLTTSISAYYNLQISVEEIGLFINIGSEVFSQNLVSLLQLLILTIVGCLRIKELQPELDFLQQFIEDFRYQHHLLSKVDFEQWLSTHNMSLSRFIELANYFCLLDFLIFRSNYDALEIKPNFDLKDWFTNVLHYTGVYKEIKQVLSLPNADERLMTKLQRFKRMNSKELLKHGFANEYELQELISAINKMPY